VLAGSVSRCDEAKSDQEGKHPEARGPCPEAISP
jgi:hypothetical protein